MDKNSIIGFILIALILFGFTFYQGKRSQKFAAEQAYRDSVELAAKIASGEIDTAAVVAVPEQRPFCFYKSSCSRSFWMSP